MADDYDRDYDYDYHDDDDLVPPSSRLRSSTETRERPPRNGRRRIRPLGPSSGAGGEESDAGGDRIRGAESYDFDDRDYRYHDGYGEDYRYGRNDDYRDDDDRERGTRVVGLYRT